MIKIDFFEGRTLFIATKHHKEKVIAPIFAKEFNISIVVDRLIDTDQFGTFSGEIERLDDPVSILRKKCELAYRYDDVDLILASEGSFGSHPYLLNVPANEEFLMLQDRKNDLELLVRTLSTETNFSGASVKSLNELTQFAQRVDFPKHGLILKPTKEDFSIIKKGISDWEDLERTYHFIYSNYNEAYVETDMRAMYNPTRMKVIEQCAQKLISLMNSNCPLCTFPGFQVTKSTSGLICSQCKFPTRSIKSLTYSCNRCKYELVEEFPNGRRTEDPTYCDVCNP